MSWRERQARRLEQLSEISPQNLFRNNAFAQHIMPELKNPHVQEQSVYDYPWVTMRYDNGRYITEVSRKQPIQEREFGAMDSDNTKIDGVETVKGDPVGAEALQGPMVFTGYSNEGWNKPFDYAGYECNDVPGQLLDSLTSGDNDALDAICTVVNRELSNRERCINALRNRVAELEHEKQCLSEFADSTEKAERWNNEQIAMYRSQLLSVYRIVCGPDGDTLGTTDHLADAIIRKLEAHTSNALQERCAMYRLTRDGREL